MFSRQLAPGRALAVDQGFPVEAVEPAGREHVVAVERWDRDEVEDGEQDVELHDERHEPHEEAVVVGVERVGGDVAVLRAAGAVDLRRARAAPAPGHLRPAR